MTQKAHPASFYSSPNQRGLQMNTLNHKYLRIFCETPKTDTKNNIGQTQIAIKSRFVILRYKYILATAKTPTCKNYHSSKNHPINISQTHDNRLPRKQSQKPSISKHQHK